MVFQYIVIFHKTRAIICVLLENHGGFLSMETVIYFPCVYNMTCDNISSQKNKSATVFHQRRLDLIFPSCSSGWLVRDLNIFLVCSKSWHRAGTLYVLQCELPCGCHIYKGLSDRINVVRIKLLTPYLQYITCLWITYSWTGNSGGNFFLVQAMKIVVIF